MSLGVCLDLRASIFSLSCRNSSKRKMSSLKRQKTMIPIDPEPLNDPGEDTNIGIWESTTELQRNETETPPMTEEDKAQDTLNALEELPGLMEEVTDHADHVHLPVLTILFCDFVCSLKRMLRVTISMSRSLICLRKPTSQTSWNMRVNRCIKCTL